MHRLFRYGVPASAAVLAAGVLWYSVGRSSASFDVRVIPPAKPADFAAFERLLQKHKDLTFERLRDRAVLPPADRPLTFDPTAVRYFDRVQAKLSLLPAERELFARVGLVSIDTGERHTFGSAYYHIYNMDLPVLVTADSILHALHRSYDDILKELEVQQFAGELRAALSSAHALLANHPQRHTEAARDADLYLIVARNLFEGAAGEPDERFHAMRGDRWVDLGPWDGTLRVRSHLGQDEAALALLREIQTLRLPNFNAEPPVPIYGGSRYIDFSQFRPRGTTRNRFS